MLAWSILPPRCLICDQTGRVDIDLCAACWRDLPFNPLCCPRCALPLSAPAPACSLCLARSPVFRNTVAPLQYLIPVSTLVPRLKFHQDLAAGRLLAEIFCRLTPQIDLPEALLPVPLHPARVRQRGFDQALELARMIAKNKSIPLRRDLLQRARNTSAQSYLDAADRRKNLANAFVASRKPMPAHVALLDDVMTTGTTVNECAKVLLKAGVKRVDIWVMARVPARR